MRECAYCGAECDSAIGIARELQTQFWGGKTGQKVEYSPKLVSFFCSDRHRSDFIAEGAVGGEVQTKRRHGTMKHDFYTDSKGNIDIWYLDEGYCNGPGCRACDGIWCEHCERGVYDEECPERQPALFEIINGKMVILPDDDD